MTVNGIIAEYNPFHNGHKYHLEESRKATGADYTIIAMSGNFTQRGTPAIINKYARTEMALLNGADLVLEIPSFYAAGSAEYFAAGAIALLDKLQVVDSLCFGSESGQEKQLEQLAGILLKEPESYKIRLKIKLKQGYSFPMARTFALMECFPALSEVIDLFRSPNNILGIEYIKSIKKRGSSITPSTTRRLGSDYHDKRLGREHSSALAIRHAVYSRQELDFLKEQLPPSSYRVMIQVMEETPPIHQNDFSLPLHYQLLNEAARGYDHYVDISPALSDRIRNHLYQFAGFRAFCELLKSKDMTYTRISRCMLHVLLKMEQQQLEEYKALDYVPYARVLGFRRDAAGLLSAIKERSSIPLITKLADADKLLSPEAYAMLQKDLAVSDIYNMVAAGKSSRQMINEVGTPIVIV